MKTEKIAYDALKNWMQRIMSEKGWSAGEWSRRADTSASNITRFLAGANDFVPSTSTLLKLADAAGVPPDIFGVNKTISNSVPLIPRRILLRMLKNNDKPAKKSSSATSAQGKKAGQCLMPTPQTLAELASKERSFERIPSLAGASEAAFAVIIETDTMNAAGIGIGDTVIVEPNQTPAAGDTVLLWKDTTVAPYVWAPPLYVPRSTDAAHFPVKAGPEVMVLGVARNLLRRL